MINNLPYANLPKPKYVSSFTLANILPHILNLMQIAGREKKRYSRLDNPTTVDYLTLSSFSDGEQVHTRTTNLQEAPKASRIMSMHFLIEHVRTRV